MRRSLTRLLLALGLAALVAAPSHGAGGHVQFVFTSDNHYGITRSTFRGAENVGAHVVNAAMVAKMNTLAGTRFPNDAGVDAGQAPGPFDFVAVGGDIANRSESADHIQSASTSWTEFTADFIGSLKLQGPGSSHPALFVVPGNHDVSNAIGFYKPMEPAVDTRRWSRSTTA